MAKEKTTKAKTTRRRPAAAKTNDMEEATALEPIEEDGKKAATNDKYETIKKGELHITALQKMTIPELSRRPRGRGSRNTRA